MVGDNHHIRPFQPGQIVIAGEQSLDQFHIGPGGAFQTRHALRAGGIGTYHLQNKTHSGTGQLLHGRGDFDKAFLPPRIAQIAKADRAACRAIFSHRDPRRNDMRQHLHFAMQEVFVRRGQRFAVRDQMHLRTESGFFHTLKSGFDARIVRKPIRVVTEMNGQSRRAVRRKAAQPMQPSRQMTRSQHLGKNHVPRGQSGRGKAPPQIGEESAPRQFLQKIQQSARPHRPGWWTRPPVPPEKRFHLRAIERLKEIIFLAQHDGVHAFRPRTARQRAVVEEVMADPVHQFVIGQP